MANTYQLIEAKTLTTTTTSITFTSIPQTYTDLKIVYSVRSDNTNPSNTIDISFNGNTTGFTNRYLIGTGSSTASGSNFGRYAGSQNSANETASTFSNGDIYIPNYTNTSINKSYSSDGVYENNATGAGQGLVAGLWSNTAAITSIGLVGYAGNFVTNSTFYLYGIKKD